ncbi:MAG: hypothetical protein ACRD2W_09570 [Acidimicrobiales bacterium]
MRLDEALSLQRAFEAELLTSVRPAPGVGDRVIQAFGKDESVRDVLRDAVAEAIRPGGVASTLTPPMLGISAAGWGQYRVAVRIERESPSQAEFLRRVETETRGEFDVRVVGRLRRLQSRDWGRGRRRPLAIGSSISLATATAGTLGCFARSPGQSSLELLSNNHVIADSNRAKLGAVIVQPGLQDGGKAPDDAVATLSRFLALEPDVPNGADCALGLLADGMPADPVSLPDGRRLEGVAEPASVADLLDLEVFKVGRTTGVTRGRVSVVNLQPRIWYGPQRLSFAGQLEIDGGGSRFSGPGDSGSLVVAVREGSACEAVGLLFAGSAQGLSYATPMGTLLGTLGVTLAV